MITSAQEAFQRLNLELPPAPKRRGGYRPFLIDGKYLHLSGHGPVQSDGSLIVGTIGLDIDMEKGQQAAWQAGLTVLSTIITNFGTLNAVKRVIRLMVMIGCTSDFNRHTYVINGCSKLFEMIWGPECGIGIRSTAGLSSLPDHVAIEIEAVFELA